MEESFEIIVTYNGEQLIFPAQLKVFGYTHRIQVNVEGQEVMFELDEEQNYRAVINSENIKPGKNINVELLRSILEAIGAIVR